MAPLARTIRPPASPQLLGGIAAWNEQVAPDLELEACLVETRDFTSVKRLEVEGCRVSRVQLAGAKLDKLQISDTVLERIEAAGMRAPETAWLRVAIQNSRLTGADLGAALFEDCTFKNVKFDEAGFRFATFKRVRFETCMLRNADFSGAKLSNVVFRGCELDGAAFDNATCTATDLRGENLAHVKGVLGLKGATISPEQLVEIAPLLAAEVGLDVGCET